MSARAALSAYAGSAVTLRGTVSRFGLREGRSDLYRPTLLLVDLADPAGQPLADHAWVDVTLSLASVHPGAGDIVELQAEVRAYTRKDGTPDFGLYNVRHARRIGRAERKR